MVLTGNDLITYIALDFLTVSNFNLHKYVFQVKDGLYSHYRPINRYHLYHTSSLHLA